LEGVDCAIKSVSQFLALLLKRSAVIQANPKQNKAARK
jgi:hypothetical protein